MHRAGHLVSSLYDFCAHLSISAEQRSADVSLDCFSISFLALSSEKFAVFKNFFAILFCLFPSQTDVPEFATCLTCLTWKHLKEALSFFRRTYASPETPSHPASTNLHFKKDAMQLLRQRQQNSATNRINFGWQCLVFG